MAKIYYTGSNDFVVPTEYEKRVDGDSSSKKTIKSSVLIKGGFGVAYGTSKERRNSGAVMTEITAEELKAVEEHPAFIRKVRNGFITIGKPPTDSKKDKSAQTTESDFKKKNPKANVSVGQTED